MQAPEIRRRFLEFFRARGHEVVPSAPLIPVGDPTLLFTNAGMVQFKNYFTGAAVPTSRRAASSQKCIRISGKHNDLEVVGRTPRHHTFFEMLGNFSFGDYFKSEAIQWALEFLVEVGVPKGRLLFTVFAGEEGVPADLEAETLWRQIAGVGAERVVRLGRKDNFWSMGETGPCGPCSEIHFYTGEGEPEALHPDAPGWIELWNLVFMQFERAADGSMKTLPRPSIDTGMGLERLTMVLEGKRSNYDTDLFAPLVELAARIAGKPYQGTDAPDDVSIRVIADHARATAFLVAEGVLPEKREREYVLRRVMRRAIRHGHRLGIGELFFHELTARVVELMGADYPELVARADLIREVTLREEEGFRATLARGLELLEQNTEWVERDGKRVLPGAVAFKLYDTYGFPLDLTQVIGEERGFDVDLAGYEAALAAQRELSRTFVSGEKRIDEVYRDVLAAAGSVSFLGYERERAQSEVVALVRNRARAVAANEGDEVEVIVTATPFYGEAGGQVGDQGRIEGPNGVVKVADTHKPLTGLVVHRGVVERGAIEVGDAVALQVDTSRRHAIRRNHSATHLLHWALRAVLGPHAEQKGSLVAPDRLRFDYSHFAQPTADEVARIEELVNEKLLENLPVETEVTTLRDALARGAMAIFEEKYGDVVRVVRIGPQSVELCGGTHASRSGDIGLFKIVSEGGIAAGVRRIEAQTGLGALEWFRRTEGELKSAAKLLRGAPLEAAAKVQKLLDHERELEKELSDLRQKLAAAGTDDLLGRAREVDGVKALGARTEVKDPRALRDLADKLRDKLGKGIVLLAAESGGRVSLVMTVTKDLTSRLDAGKLIRDVAAVVGGSGGGRPDMAQAGGTDPSRIDEAIERFHEAVARAAEGAAG
ncbi:MAG: alanine--tRNA ligase [Deltaproteobacteria bacterium]|nr:alanine--tRNA ligase [Deltaproteobacteria bacterium]